MKHIFRLGCFLLLVPMLIHAEGLVQDTEVTLGTQTACVSSYLKDLEDLGYCVIPQILSNSETELLYQRVWHEFIEKAWPACKMSDRSNWKETFPIHNKRGIFAGPAGQTQVMWDLRQDPRIVNIFAQVWNTNDLIVSMDGLSLMCPPEIREGFIDPWPHVDQVIIRRRGNFAHDNNPPIGFISESLLKTRPYTIQGQFLFEDSFDGDGGFYCIPKSHLRFAEFAPELEAISEMEMPLSEKRKIRQTFLEGFFSNSKDECGNFYCTKHITAPRGSLILWDSRTVHWNQHANKYRGNGDRVRMVGYLCYVPKKRLTEENRAIRKHAFDTGVSTGHNPAHPELKYTKDYIQPDFIQYLEDKNYTQPKITLTSLGEDLLGVKN